VSYSHCSLCHKALPAALDDVGARWVAYVVQDPEWGWVHKSCQVTVK
jgi:hypothetical protein